MNAYDFFDKLIVNQETIKKGVSILAEQIVSGENLNILFRAASGYGKTKFAFSLLAYINKTLGGSNGYYYICKKKLNPNLERRIQILDEVHMIKDPENLYSLMDSGENTFILCTNEYGDLKEPLTNRCLQFNFSPYSIIDLKEIARRYFKRKKILIEDDRIYALASLCRGTPRDILLICMRLYFLMRVYGQNLSPHQINNLLYENFGIRDGGFTEIDLRYIEFVSRNSPVGIDTIYTSLSIPKQIVREEIEPFLVRKGIIKITPRGRIIC